MGMNGQLLTPQAGRRCRLAAISTDAPLVRDASRDFGVPAVCDRCRACLRRCPSGAIPVKRSFYRGVEKTKLNLARCFPVVAQVHGCSVCMKVCPVRRYGLDAVYDHFERTGEVPGVGTDELEGYDWPLDGCHYGPGDGPKLPTNFLDVPGFNGQARRETVAVIDNPPM
jgi:epoxyqueuosine reductase